MTAADIDYIAPRVLELVYTAWDLKPFAEDMGYHGEPFKWDEERRAHLRAELDAYYARLYGLSRDELRYVLDPQEVYGSDFPGRGDVPRADEVPVVGNGEGDEGVRGRCAVGRGDWCWRSGMNCRQRIASRSGQADEAGSAFAGLAQDAGKQIGDDEEAGLTLQSAHGDTNGVQIAGAFGTQ